MARQDAGELGDGVELPLRIVQRVEDEHLGAGVEDALELLAAVLRRPQTATRSVRPGAPYCPSRTGCRAAWARCTLSPTAM